MYLGSEKHYAVLIVGGARDGQLVIDDLERDEAIDYAEGLRCYDDEVAVPYDKSTDLILEA